MRSLFFKDLGKVKKLFKQVSILTVTDAFDQEEYSEVSSDLIRRHQKHFVVR